MSFRLSEAEYKTVQRAVKDKLAERTGGAADEVLPEYVMVVRCATTHTPRARYLLSSA